MRPSSDFKRPKIYEKQFLTLLALSQHERLMRASQVSGLSASQIARDAIDKALIDFETAS